MVNNNLQRSSSVYGETCKSVLALGNKGNMRLLFDEVHVHHFTLIIFYHCSFLDISRTEKLKVGACFTQILKRFTAQTKNPEET